MLQSNVSISKVNVGIINQNVKFTDSRGIVSISSSHRVIDEEDVQRVLSEAKPSDLPLDYKIIHILPQEYIINNTFGKIINPIGMSGSKLEVLAKVVSVPSLDVENISLCLKRNNLELGEIVLEPIATGLAVLDEQELESGVALVDVGELSTEVAIFIDGVLRYFASVPLGGRHITDDMRTLMKVVYAQAEEVKRNYGHCYLPMLREDKQIIVPGIKGRKPMTFTRSQICRYIQPRMEEIFTLALESLRSSGLINKLELGVVLTGGSMLIEGVEDLASQVFGMPVRLGTPSDLNYQGLSQEVNKPYFSTAVGLAIYGLKYSTTKEKVEFVQTEDGNAKKGKFWDMVINFFKKL
jgi:cell division protein FtsA